MSSGADFAAGRSVAQEHLPASFATQVQYVVIGRGGLVLIGLPALEVMEVHELEPRVVHVLGELQGVDPLWNLNGRPKFQDDPDCTRRLPVVGDHPRTQPLRFAELEVLNGVCICVATLKWDALSIEGSKLALTDLWGRDAVVKEPVPKMPSGHEKRVELDDKGSAAVRHFARVDVAEIVQVPANAVPLFRPVFVGAVCQPESAAHITVCHLARTSVPMYVRRGPRTFHETNGNLKLST